jgi:hypothetical protein
VSVRDSNEQFVSDLRKEDFRIREDGRTQMIRSVSLESMPLSAALLIDTGFELKQFSITLLAGAFGSNDEAAVYGFSIKPSPKHPALRMLATRLRRRSGRSMKRLPGCHVGHAIWTRGFLL